ncbi:MAG: hypothetical protein K1X66_05905 [Verrucomicrobiae bacterium]|nr:hypothetical protein [Verrucomicrobiae bacterium]
MKNFFLIFGMSLFVVGCATVPDSPDRPDITAAELNANPPEYWLGQRVYYTNLQVWGWVKRPEESWDDARLVLLKEDKCLAPHRSLGNRTADQNFQYRLYGRYWQHKGYEPVMNKLLDVFELEHYESLGQHGPLDLRLPVVMIPPAGNRSHSRPSNDTHRRDYEDIY